MKKFLSMITALCCTASLMAVLPASVQANAVAEPKYDPWVCRVSLINYDEQNQPESYILSENMREFNLISAEDMQTYIADGSELPAVGDVLEVYASMKMGKLAEFAFEENSAIINQGSEKDYYTETKQYLVTKKYLDENHTFCWTRLTDPETGQVSLYTDYDFYYDSVYSLKDTEIGDTVTCAMNYIDRGTKIEVSYPTQVLSIEKGDGTLPELPEYDAYPEADSAGRFVFQATSSYVVNGCDIVNTSDVFLYTEENEFPQYGDVYKGKYYIKATYPGQFVPCSMMKKVGTVEDFYSVKEVTVVLNHPKEDNLVLTDAEGNIYRYHYDTYNFGKWKFDIPIQNLQAGDTLKCAFDENSVVLVTEILNTSAVETSVQEEDYQLSVCIGTTSYGNHVFTPYTPLRSDTEEKYMNDMSLHYGDVVKFPNSFLEAIENSKEPENTNIENLGSASAYYDGVKTLKVTSNANTILCAEDADGNSYFCLYHPSMNSKYIQNTPVAMDKMEVGKSYDFIVSGNEIIIPDLMATGDADRNGSLDILDVITVNKAVLGKETISDEIIPLIDFNQNGKPDADDALTMLKKIVGLA